jgi:hypothetical protein
MRPQTWLLRQIHPSFVQAGRVTSQAFRPTPKDDNHLSVYDGDRIAPQAAWQHFTANPNCRSAGVMALACEECAALDLPVHADGIPFAEHCSIDFSGFEKKDVERKAKILAVQAQQRGWQFGPVSG